MKCMKNTLKKPSVRRELVLLNGELVPRAIATTGVIEGEYSVVPEVVEAVNNGSLLFLVTAPIKEVIQ